MIENGQRFQKTTPPASERGIQRTFSISPTEVSFSDLFWVFKIIFDCCDSFLHGLVQSTLSHINAASDLLRGPGGAGERVVPFGSRQPHYPIRRGQEIVPPQRDGNPRMCMRARMRDGKHDMHDSYEFAVSQTCRGPSPLSLLPLWLFVRIAPRPLSHVP